MNLTGRMPIWLLGGFSWCPRSTLSMMPVAFAQLCAVKSSLSLLPALPLLAPLPPGQCPRPVSDLPLERACRKLYISSNMLRQPVRASKTTPSSCSLTYPKLLILCASVRFWTSSRTAGPLLRLRVLLFFAGFCSILACGSNSWILCGGANKRGTQQGGSHSPTLFGRILAARFSELTAQWELKGEIPAYRAGLLLLWVLWFIDDSVLLFRNAAQMTRLMPC